MDSYPNYNPDDELNYPAAPKGGSGPEGAPLGPDHNPPSGAYTPNDESWAGGAAFPLSSPYTGMSSGEPPAPIFRPELDGPGVARGGFPSRTDVGARDKPTNRRRVLAGIGAFLLLVLVIGGLAFVLLGGGSGTNHPTANGGNSNGGGAPVVVGTDTPTPTPTLLPGQTPLPTAIPPTATIALAPGQPTPTPLPFGSSASVSFTRATQGVASSGSVTVSTGASDSRLKVVAVNGSADSGNVSANGQFHDGQNVAVSMTVHNPTGNTVGSFAGTIISGSNSVNCSIATSIGLVPNQTATQECDEPEANNQLSNYNYTNPATGLVYTGSASAGGFPPYYIVPSGCGSATAAQSAAKSALLTQLGGEMGGSTTYLSLPDLSYSILSCTPGAGQTISGGGSTFTQNITATGSQAGYFPSGVSDYQKSQVGASGAGWQLIGSNGCSPSVQSGNLASANVACQATGTEAWNSFNLGGMAQLIHGQTQATAKGELNAVQGVVANSETFSVAGGSYLPTNANNISFHYAP